MIVSDNPDGDRSVEVSESDVKLAMASSLSKASSSPKH